MLAKTDLPSGITHEVLNQPPPLEHVNFYAQDLPLREAVAREGGAWGETRLMRYGEIAGNELIQLGFQANQHKPVLKTHDRYGHRIDEVEFHPAYHRLMQVAIEHELPTLPWRDPRPGAHVVSHALSYLHSQVEAGTGCPLTMTYACIPALRHQPEVARVWEPRILSTEYDPRCLPAEQKRGVTIGMGMTEKQGGSDVRANTTRAYPLGAGGDRPTSWSATSGFSPRRCATPSWCWRRPSAACPASCCRAGGRTARATPSTSSGSRTSSATGAMPPARSSSTAPGR
jgi:putative acyl-CoA dehydrogenase